MTVTLPSIQHSIEAAAAFALDHRDELILQGLNEFAEEALELRDRLEGIVADLVDYQEHVNQTSEEISPSFESQTTSSMDPTIDTPFDHEGFMSYYYDSGMSRAELSRQTGIASSVLLRLEQGETNKPHKATVKKLAKALGVRPSDLDDRFSPPRGA